MAQEPRNNALPEADGLIGHTVEIVAAYVAHNSVSPGDLSKTLADVHQALRSVRASTSNSVTVPELTPAVPVRKSVTPEFIVCLDDGRKFKWMKRHLSLLGMT